MDHVLSERMRGAIWDRSRKGHEERWQKNYWLSLYDWAG